MPEDKQRRPLWSRLASNLGPTRQPFNPRRSNWFYLAVILALLLLRLLYTSTLSGGPPSSAKFAIVTYESRPVSYWRESLGNKIRYARRHGYDLLPTLETSQIDGGVWAKIPLIKDALDSGPYEWILFMDFDTLFTNLSITIEDFLQDAEQHHLHGDQRWEDVNMIAAPDCRSFNAGVLFFRNSGWSRWFLDRVWSLHTKEFKGSEQDAMRNILESMDEFEKPNHFLRVSQYKLNSFPEELSCHQDRHKPWAPGYWIIHFAGAWTYFRDHPDPFGALLGRYYHRVVE